MSFVKNIAKGGVTYLGGVGAEASGGALLIREVGGVLATHGSSYLCFQCSFELNACIGGEGQLSGSAQGGAIACFFGTSEITLQSSYFGNNSATGGIPPSDMSGSGTIGTSYGGAIMVQSGSITIDNCEFFDNVAGYVLVLSQLSQTSYLLAPSFGGAIYQRVLNGRLSISQSDFSNNKASIIILPFSPINGMLSCSNI